MHAKRTATAPQEGRYMFDRGSMSVELALFAPVIVLLIMLGLLAHRTASSQIDLQTAAHAAARAATVQTNTAAASAAASATAEAMRPRWCATYSVSPVIGGLEAGGTVTVNLTCTTETVENFGSRTLTATASSPVDQWRSEEEAP
jgi:Flp pilus assembly protein TadG